VVLCHNNHSFHAVHNILSNNIKIEISGTTVLSLVALCKYETWSLTRTEWGAEEDI